MSLFKSLVLSLKVSSKFVIVDSLDSFANIEGRNQRTSELSNICFSWRLFCVGTGTILS